jgi:hypothetical protein
MEGERALRLGVSPGHWREDDAHRPHVQPSAYEYDDHKLDDDLLQVRAHHRQSLVYMNPLELMAK